MEESVDIKELLNKNLIIVENIERKASMFSKSMLILSLLDVFFGILAIFCTSLQVTALIASASSLTAITICGRVIQVSKLRQVEKSLRTLDLISLTWFINKYKKYLEKKETNMKLTKSTVLQKILTSVMAVFGIGGVVVYFLPQFTPFAQQISNMVAMASEVVAVLSGIWLSGTSDKVLTAEELAEKQKAEQEKKIEKAKALIAKSQETEIALQEARALVAQAEQQNKQ